MSAPTLELEAAKAPAWSDERLVRECRNGNEEAWSALIEKYKNLIFSIPIKYELPRDDAGDIFQSVCADLLADLPRLREPRALAKWLIRTTTHKCIHWKQRERRFVATEDDFDAPDPARAARTEEIIAEAQQEQMLRESIAVLKPRCAQMVRMLFFETPARAYNEIARELGLATGSIGFIRGRCLDQLKKELLKRGWK